MKKILIIGSLAFAGLYANAQEVKVDVNNRIRVEREREVKNDNRLTPEQLAELRVKKLVLDLDLTEKQQKKLFDLEKKSFDNRTKAFNKKGKKNKEERFEKQKDRLDDRIEYKREMKKILSKKQFEKWEASENKVDRKKTRKEGNDEKRRSLRR